MGMNFKTILYGSPQYQKSLEWRNAILRAPLGLILGYDEIRNEYRATHIVGTENGEIICGFYLNYLYDGRWDLNCAFVVPERQGGGIGREMLNFAEDYVARHGGSVVCVSTRTHAAGFYEKAGYALDGELFEKLGLEFVQMKKNIG